MPSFRCPTATCPDTAVFTKFGVCKACKAKLIDEKNIPKSTLEAKAKLGETPVPKADPFADAVTAVQQAMTKKGLTYPKSYQERVITALADADPYFQQDFIDEMKKGTEVSRFITPEERQNNYMTVCVDSALTATGSAKDKDHPVGEKFDFELPHILAVAKWEFITAAGRIYKETLSHFCARAKTSKGRVFMLSSKLKATDPIGHMLTITVEDSGDAYVTDAQELSEFFVPTAVYLAWMGPLKSGRVAGTPRRQVDLDKAKWATGSAWEK